MDPTEACPVVTPSSKRTHQRPEEMRSESSRGHQWHVTDQLLPFFVHKASGDCLLLI